MILSPAEGGAAGRPQGVDGVARVCGLQMACVTLGKGGGGDKSTPEHRRSSHIAGSGFLLSRAIPLALLEAGSVAAAQVTVPHGSS